MATTKTELEEFCNCTLLSSEKQIKFQYKALNAHLLTATAIGNMRSQEGDEAHDVDPIETCMKFLLNYEFIRLQMNETTNEINFIATRLGNACLGKCQQRIKRK